LYSEHAAASAASTYSEMRGLLAYGGFRCGDIAATRNSTSEMMMGKYVLAWLLGVPALVLVGVYAFTHLV